SASLDTRALNRNNRSSVPKRYCRWNLEARAARSVRDVGPRTDGTEGEAEVAAIRPRDRGGGRPVQHDRKSGSRGDPVGRNGGAGASSLVDRLVRTRSGPDNGHVD